MELRSGRRLRSVSTPGSRRRRQLPGCSDGGGPDLISALPDEMLLQILVRLRCARAAPLASALSRRWRGLWSHLPELSFREMPSYAVAAALGQVACSALSRLEIDIPKRHRITDPARVSALIRAAARLAPADLVFTVRGPTRTAVEIPIEIPCFPRAISLKLDAVNLRLAPPAEGVEFPVLETLSLAGGTFDVNEMIRRCPRLRVLEVRNCTITGSVYGSIKVHSSTIEELVVDSFGYLGNIGVDTPVLGYLSDIDIVTPVLRQLKFTTLMGKDFSVLFSAPMVEDLSWSCVKDNVGIGEIWYLSTLNLCIKDNVCILGLSLGAMNWLEPVERDMVQEIAPLPKFSVLELSLAPRGHVFGAMVLNLLQTYTAIRRLKVVLRNYGNTQSCSPNYPCDEPRSWRSKSITLMYLEEIEIDGFEGTDHEVDFLKLLFRCATLMKRMIVKLSPRNRGYKEICRIFEANPSVDCHVHRSSGQR